MVVEVTSCRKCPFILAQVVEFGITIFDFSENGFDSTMMMPENEIHENCPLRKGDITVTLKKES